MMRIKDNSGLICCMKPYSYHWILDNELRQRILQFGRDTLAVNDDVA